MIFKRKTPIQRANHRLSRVLVDLIECQEAFAEADMHPEALLCSAMLHRCYELLQIIDTGGTE